LKVNPIWRDRVFYFINICNNPKTLSTFAKIIILKSVGRIDEAPLGYFNEPVTNEEIAIWLKKPYINESWHSYTVHGKNHILYTFENSTSLITHELLEIITIIPENNVK
jgi:hypothetical protein